jgi:aspartate kinase
MTTPRARATAHLAERAVVHGTRASPPLAMITVAGAPRSPGVTAEVFRTVADTGVGISAAVRQVVSATGRVDLSLTVPWEHRNLVADALARARQRIGFDRVLLDQVVEVTLVGAGMRVDPSVPAIFCEALALADVLVESVSIENDRISVVCPRSQLPAAARALHEVFEVAALQPACPRRRTVGGKR